MFLGSQPTYEELKPDMRQRREQGDLRSQPTYEELKHDMGICKFDHLGRSQPTYEELKHINFTGLPAGTEFPAYL